LLACPIASCCSLFLPSSFPSRNSPTTQPREEEEEEENRAQGEQQAEEEAEGGGEGPSDHYYGCDFAFHGHRAFV
jgi:hypothetical protein